MLKSDMNISSVDGIRERITPLYAMYTTLNLQDTLQGCILFFVASALPFSIWLMKNFLDTVPIELEEAAAIDGASTFKGLWYVVLPLAAPGDFSHPETLIYIDGEAYAASDRHHQEVRLSGTWRDGQEHVLAMTVWTGLGNDDLLGLLARTVHPTRDFASLVAMNLLMQPCKVVQLDQPTRDFVTTVRVALGAVATLAEDVPARQAFARAGYGF